MKAFIIRLGKRHSYLIKTGIALVFIFLLSACNEKPNTVQLEVEPIPKELKLERVNKENKLDPKANIPEFIVEDFEKPVTMYAQTKVNIRKGPGIDYDRIGTLSINDEVIAIGQSGDWYCYEYNGETAFTKGEYLALEKVDLEAIAAAERARLVEQAKEAMARGVLSKLPPEGVIMVGDSRCVGMQKATGGGGVTWIAEKSKGYSWFVNTAMPEIDSKVREGTKIIICLGVNDLDNVRKYIKKVNQKAAEWAAKGATTYYVSVNPVRNYSKISNSQIESFNATIASSLEGITWIDTYPLVTATGFGSKDGLHYDRNTSIQIFNMIIGSL